MVATSPASASGTSPRISPLTLALLEDRCAAGLRRPQRPCSLALPLALAGCQCARWASIVLPFCSCSGWYAANWQYAMPLDWGREAGCEFAARVPKQQPPPAAQQHYCQAHGQRRQRLLLQLHATRLRPALWPLLGDLPPAIQAAHDAGTPALRRLDVHARPQGGGLLCQRQLPGRRSHSLGVR